LTARNVRRLEPCRHADLSHLSMFAIVVVDQAFFKVDAVVGLSQR
jgi:hypothetical protein